ncbi:MAG TPA: UbiA family prenyltransferase [Thermoplasmata archaeon]|nr:UbiA family prenyltransferase [Thermoplasmata archaeon]
MLGAAAVVRPGNVTLSAVAVAIGAVVAVGPSALPTLAVPLALAAAAAAAFTAAGNALNDSFDAETDRVNHPDRPIPRGLLTPRGALGVAAALFTLAVILSVFVTWESLLVVLLNLAFMASYEVALKARGASGNVLIAYLVGSLFLFAGTSTYGGDGAALARAGVLALLAALATLGREIAKDIEDVRGDVDRTTLPKALGSERAGVLASAAFATAAGLSVLPYVLGILPLLYLLIVLAADAILIYCALFSASTERRIGRVSKYGMVLALMAFLAGALG